MACVGCRLEAVVVWIVMETWFGLMVMRAWFDLKVQLAIDSCTLSNFAFEIS